MSLGFQRSPETNDGSYPGQDSTMKDRIAATVVGHVTVIVDNNVIESLRDEIQRQQPGDF